MFSFSLALFTKPDIHTASNEINAWKSTILRIPKALSQFVFLLNTFDFVPKLEKIANAALSGEQRQPQNLNHCTLNT
ncbi:hypothetical protein CGH06_23995 [Vibrio parahaemolyticus]|nr:hypothetical protein CGH06_23995 [Vibrio parahaemolyticus]